MEKNQGWLEKRKHKRVESALRLQYTTLEDKEVETLLTGQSLDGFRNETIYKAFHSDKLLRAYTEDISTGGLLMASDKPLHDGQYLLVEVILPSKEQSVRVIAMVVRVMEKEAASKGIHRHGIQIVSIHREDLQTIEKYVQGQMVQDIQKKVNKLS